MGILRAIISIFVVSGISSDVKRTKYIPRGVGEPDPEVGKVFFIDYNNGHKAFLGRKIRVQFVLNSRGRHIIRAYCFYSTRLRWFKISEISKIYSENGEVVSVNAANFFSETQPFETR